jgi:hypothetical protein
MKKMKKSEDYYILFFFGVCCYIISIALIALAVALFFYSDSNNWHLSLVIGTGAYIGGNACFQKAKQRKWEKKK